MMNIRLELLLNTQHNYMVNGPTELALMAWYAVDRKPETVPSDVSCVGNILLCLVCVAPGSSWYSG